MHGKSSSSSAGQFLIGIICVLAFTGPVRPEQQFDMYSELPSESNQRIDHLPLSDAESAQAKTEEANTPRLIDLLKLKQSILETYSRAPLVDTNESSSGNQATNSGTVEKRVFCNGFTGCGGRFRGRRRQQPVAEIWKRLEPAFGKRPFCNSYGCYKRFDQEPQASETQQVIAHADRWPDNRRKKLFCNGYGGCQNLGKRLVIVDDGVSRDVNESQRMSNAFIRAVLGGKKRVYTSSMEEDLDNLVAAIRR